MQTLEKQFSWCDVEPNTKKLLLLATENWEFTGLAEKYIKEALSKSGKNLYVLISAYRFFFYKHKPIAALSVVEQVLNIISVEENLPNEWSQLKPILISNNLNPKIRLYINSYAAKSLVLAQLGRLDEAKIISQRVQEIDENRESCATTVFEILTKPDDDDDYDDD